MIESIELEHPYHDFCIIVFISIVILLFIIQFYNMFIDAIKNLI
jgi:hypothetical protein